MAMKIALELLLALDEGVFIPDKGHSIYPNDSPHPIWTDYMTEQMYHPQARLLNGD